jgi:phage virion morphogenesis protein
LTDNFNQLAPWVAAIAKRFGDGNMRKIARKIGLALRRTNAQRIARNVEPDGSTMEPRKPRPLRDRKKDRVKKKGRMFPKIRLARNMNVDASADHVELSFNGKVAKTAEVHHFGLRDRVARIRGAAQYRYPARELLGFGADDDDAILAAVLDGVDA